MKKKLIISLTLAVLTLLSVYALSACGHDDAPEAAAPGGILSLLGTDSIEKGDHIFFGSYPQGVISGSDEFADEPIEWRVLSVEDDKALIISEYLLDSRTFDDISGAWRFSNLRRWMNGHFLNKAFSDSEQEYILLTANEDTNTEDRVFCLSSEEARNYLKSYKELKAAPTPFARKKGVHSDGGYTIDGVRTARWWLRTPYLELPARMACVGSGGTVIDSGADVDVPDLGVRPAMWVSLAD